MMENAALEAIVIPNKQLFAKYDEALGAMKVEKFIKILPSLWEWLLVPALRQINVKSLT